MRLMDFTGQRFGRWVVLSRAERPDGKKQGTFWLCRCKCGTEKVVPAVVLRDGRSQSCGCRKSEIVTARSTKHGFTPYGQRPPPTYWSWQAMIRRCTYEKDRYFKDYGGRGIRVCERWRHDFAAFLADMGEKPRGHSLERRDNDGNYEPGNCYWATVTQQANNKRNNRVLTFRGRSMTTAQWAAEIGIHTSTLCDRLRFWSLEAALTTPKVPMDAPRKAAAPRSLRRSRS